MGLIPFPEPVSLPAGANRSLTQAEVRLVHDAHLRAQLDEDGSMFLNVFQSMGIIGDICGARPRACIPRYPMPADPLTHDLAAMAHHLLVQEQTADAMMVFEGLVAACPDDSVFHCHLAAAYVQAGHYTEALEEYTRAIQLDASNADALVGRSELLLREGQVAEAVDDLQATLRLDPLGEHASTRRARTLLVLLKKLADR